MVQDAADVPVGPASLDSVTDWVTISDYPDTGEAQLAETTVGDFRLIVRRTRLVGAQAQLFPDWRHHAFATNRTVPLLTADIDHRDHAQIELAIRDLKDQALCHFPSGRMDANSAWTRTAPGREQRLDRDRRDRAQPRTLGNPDRAPDPARADRPQPAPAAAADPRPPDPHQPAMDPPDARPLAWQGGLHHRARHHPRAPRPLLSATTGHRATHEDQQQPRPPPGTRTGARKPGHEMLPRHSAGTPTPPTTPNAERTPATHRHPPEPGKTGSPRQRIGDFRLSQTDEPERLALELLAASSMAQSRRLLEQGSAIGGWKIGLKRCD